MPGSNSLPSMDNIVYIALTALARRRPGPRTRQLSGQWDSWTAGQLGTDRRGTAAAATQPKHHSPATGRVLRPWVVAWAVQMQWALACVVAWLLARLHASPKIGRSRDDRDRPSTGGGGSMRLAMDTARLVRMLAGCRFVGVRSSIRRPAVPDMAG